jgi:hypothetical protein
LRPPFSLSINLTSPSWSMPPRPPIFVFQRSREIYALFMEPSAGTRTRFAYHCPLSTFHRSLFPWGGVEAELNLTRYTPLLAVNQSRSPVLLSAVLAPFVFQSSAKIYALFTNHSLPAAFQPVIRRPSPAIRSSALTKKPRLIYQMSVTRSRSTLAEHGASVHRSSFVLAFVPPLLRKKRALFNDLLRSSYYPLPASGYPLSWGDLRQN